MPFLLIYLLLLFYVLGSFWLGLAVCVLPLYPMSFGVMIKGLPHNVSYRRLEYLLRETELTQYVASSYIPKVVFERKDDWDAPLAFAFVNFYEQDAAEYAYKRIHHHGIHEKEEGKWYVLHTSYANSSGKREEASSQVSKPKAKKHKWVVRSGGKDDEHDERLDSDPAEEHSQMPLTLAIRKQDESPSWPTPTQWGWRANGEAWDESPAYPDDGSWRMRYDEIGGTSSSNSEYRGLEKPPLDWALNETSKTKTFKEQVCGMNEEELHDFIRGVMRFGRQSW